MELNISNTHGAFLVAVAKEIQRSNSPSVHKPPSTLRQTSSLLCPDNEEGHFLKELQEIQSRREEIGKWHSQARLRAQVDREIRALADLQERLRAFNVAADSECPQVQPPPPPPSNNSIRQLRPVSLGLQQRPYDNPLQKIPCCHQPLWMRRWLTCHVASSWSEQVSAQRPPEQLHVSNASEMFLRPAVAPTGEKVLRIVVFIDSIIPRDEVYMYCLT